MTVMKNYVLGFLFDERFERVVLILKKRPQWQAGRYNGVGGHIEDGEHPMEAMRREFEEETGVNVTTWQEYLLLGDEKRFRMHCFWAVGDVLQPASKTDEAIAVATIREVLDNHWGTIGNLPWLIAMARQVAIGAEGCVHFQVVEGTPRAATPSSWVTP